MRKLKKWRYYCDHCDKGGCSAGHMKKHEARCTRNPNRVCTMCQYATGAPGPHHTMGELIQALVDTGIDGLRDLCEGCPACMLAAIVQERDKQLTTPGGEPHWYDFDFKKERDAMFAEHNSERRGGLCGY